MVKGIGHMPPGALGFEAVGEVDDDDVEKVLAPASNAWVARHPTVFEQTCSATALPTN
jgi:hypothetical protein